MGDEQQKPPNDGQPAEPPKAAEQAAPSTPAPERKMTFGMDVSGQGSINNQAPQITNNFFYGFASAIRGTGSSSAEGIQAVLQQLGKEFGNKELGKELENALSGLRTAAYAETATAVPTPPSGILLPASDEEVDEWFLALDIRGRCAVRALAVLSGAPAHEVSQAREELCSALEAKQAPAASTGSAATPPAPERPPSARDLLAATFSEVRVVNGATRLFWRTAGDQSGVSFGERVLALLAGEIGGTRGVPGENVLAQITGWAAHGTGERRWRAARALGVIWWQLSQAQLVDLGEEWATSASDTSRESAAGLIFGAFEIESTQIEQVKQAGEPAPSRKTLGILKRWSDEAFTRASDQGLIQAVATACLFIGHSDPETALDGLDYLVQLDPASERRDDHSLTFGAYVLALLAYVTLAWSGQARPVVARLAAHAERIIRRPRQPSALAALRQADPSGRFLRERMLFAIFFIWFLLVASAAGTIDGVSDPDALTLPAQIQIPDERGRDPLLLAVLLDLEASLRQNIATLMTAAFCHTRAPLASETLRRWAGVVAGATARDSGALTSAHAPAEFTRFLIAIGQETRRWDGTIGGASLDTGFAKYRNLLGHWPHGVQFGTTDRGAAELADAALRQLAATATTIL